MRNYLQKKIDVVEKLNSIVPNENKHIVLSESDWDELEVFLDSVENLFVKRLKQKHPNLSKSVLRLMMLLRLKLSQKALASIYCISEKAIKQKLFLYKDKVGIKMSNFRYVRTSKTSNIFLTKVSFRPKVSGGAI